MSDQSQSTEPTASPEPQRATIEALYADLRSLNEESNERLGSEIQDVTQLLAEAYGRGLIDSRVRDLRTRDAAEAFVGSVIFASPLLVEDGIFDIGAHLFGSTVASLPVFLIANTLFVVFMTYALLEWTGRNREESAVVFGVVPLRLFTTLTVSFLVAAVLMTVWGRVGGWASPVEALARINVLWTVGSLGAALGDILPGESSGEDINDELATIGDGGDDRPQS